MDRAERAAAPGRGRRRLARRRSTIRSSTRWCARRSQYNPDLRVAAARVEQAAGYVKVAGATLYPQVNALARGGGALSGDSSGLEGVGIFANWELDLWGRVRAGRASARDAVRLGGARRRVRAPVARRAGRQELVPRHRGAAAEGDRRGHGRLRPSASSTSRRTACASAAATRYDVALARANVATYRDSVRSLDLAYRQALRALEALAGRYPAAALEVPAQLAADARAGAGRHALGAARAPPRRGRRRAARRRGVLPRRGSEGRAPAAHLAHRGGDQHLERALRAQGPRQPGVERRRLAHRAALPRRRSCRRRSRSAPPSRSRRSPNTARVGARAFGEVENALSSALRARGARGDPDARPSRTTRARSSSRTCATASASGDLRAVQQQSLALHAARTALLRVQAERLVQRVNLHLALGGSFMRGAGRSGLPAEGIEAISSWRRRASCRARWRLRRLRCR